MRYHIREDGTPGKCTATPGNCPLGNEVHYSTEIEARLAYEEKMTGSISKAKNLSGKDCMHGTVTAIASGATAHNSGETVLERIVKEDGAVHLKMSSWPRANEAKIALEQKGFQVAFGPNKMGQWIYITNKSIN